MAGGLYSSYSPANEWEHNHDDASSTSSSSASSSSMTKRKQQQSGKHRSRAQQQKQRDAQSLSSVSSSTAAARRSRALATTLVCACVGTFVAFSGSAAPWNNGRGLRANSRLLQAAEEYDGLQSMAQGQGRALDPQQVVEFLEKYGLEMKDLEILAQLKGTKTDNDDKAASSSSETSSSSSSPSFSKLTSSSSGSSETANPSDGGMTSQFGSSESTAGSSGGSFATPSSFSSLSSSSSGTSTQSETGSAMQEGGMQMGMQQPPFSSSSTQQFQTMGSSSQQGMTGMTGMTGGSSMQMQQQPQQQDQNGFGMQMQQQQQQQQPFMQMPQGSSSEQMTGGMMTGTGGTSMQQFPQQASSFMSSGSGMTEGGTMDQQQQQQQFGSFQQMPADGGSSGSSSSSMTTTAESTSGGEGSSTGLAELSNFKDSWDPWEASDVPIFFHIPKAGGSTVKDVIGTCHRFVMATEYGVTDGHDADTEIAVVYPAGGPPGTDRSPFVNVDTTTVDGIQRAKSMGFADAGLADAVVTPFIYEANDLFTPTAKGRLFTVFRHPIERAISMFYYIQVADWEPTYSPDLKDWTIEQYAESDRVENNWMTRQLSKQLSGDLTDENLKVAMEVIRSKFLVGLMTEMDRTMERFEKFFRWKYKVNPPNQEACREKLMHGGSNTNSKGKKKDKPKEGDVAWEKLMWQNQYDMQLYEYIESLFEEQESFVEGIPDGFRSIDATCCKCDPPTFPPEGFECPQAVLN